MMGLLLRQLVAGLSLDVLYRSFNLPLDAALDSLDTGGWHIGVEFQHGHGLLCEAVQLLRSEPLEVGEELQLPLGTQASTEGFRDVLEVPRGIQGLDIAPKAVAGVENRRYAGVLQRLDVPDDTEVLVMAVEVPDDAIAGEKEILSHMAEFEF